MSKKWKCPKCGSNRGWCERIRAEVIDSYDGDRNTVSVEINRGEIIEIYCSDEQCELEVKDIN